MKSNQEQLGEYKNPQELINMLELLEKRNHLKNSSLTEISEALTNNDLVKERYQEIMSDLKTQIDSATESYKDLVDINYSISIASDVILESQI
jgi:uncharacterized coiled-coil protein SlyX